jgi:hypothetical protein
MMRSKLNLIILFCIILNFVSCTTGKSQLTASDSSNSKKGRFQEDLSGVRIKYGAKEDTVKIQVKDPNAKPVVPSKHIGRALNLKMDSIAERNKRLKFAEGYRIQVYSGDKKEEAMKAKNKVYDLAPDVDVYPEFRSPVFRVRVGDFLDRLEANYVLVKLQKDFPNALIVPDKINIVKQ